MLTGVQSDNFQKSSSEIAFEQVCAQVNHFFRSTFPKSFLGKTQLEILIGCYSKVSVVISLRNTRLYKDIK